MKSYGHDRYVAPIDRENPRASRENVTIRFSKIELKILEALVASYNKEYQLELSRSDLIRTLIRRDAAARKIGPKWPPGT